jgi:hypothetical protein
MPFEFDLDVPGYRVVVTVGEKFGLQAESGSPRPGGVTQNVTAGRDSYAAGRDMVVGPGARRQVTISDEASALTLTVPADTTVLVHAGTEVQPDASARRGQVNFRYV